jgi:hypothetical protein
MSDKYCRRKLQRGGASIFIQSHLQFTTLNLAKYCVDQDIEICALKLDSTFLNICGDVNVHNLQESDKKSQLNALLNSYNIFSIVQFPTRTYKNSISAIDNIFIDTTKRDIYDVIPVMNGPSDHDAQIIKLYTSYNNKSHECQTYFRRNINKYTMAEFQTA